MAGSVNKVILIGNLGADPEIRRTQDGRPVANLRLATSESWSDKATGERKEKTEWHRVVIFNENLCRIAEQYLKKGSKVYHRRRAADAQMAGPSRARTAIRPKWCCRAFAASSRCSIAPAARQAAAAAISARKLVATSAPRADARSRRSGGRRGGRGSAATWTTRFRSKNSSSPRSEAMRSGDDSVIIALLHLSPVGRGRWALEDRETGEGGIHGVTRPLSRLAVSRSPTSPRRGEVV